MGLETGSTIADLNENWPLGSDAKSTADDHLRLIKDVIKTDVPSKSAENTLTGVNKFQNTVRVQYTNPELRIEETDQTDPAGRFQFRGSAGTLLLERSTAASWASKATVWTVDASGNVTFAGTVTGTTASFDVDSATALTLDRDGQTGTNQTLAELKREGTSAGLIAAQSGSQLELRAASGHALKLNSHGSGSNGIAINTDGSVDVAGALDVTGALTVTGVATFDSRIDATSGDRLDIRSGQSTGTVMSLQDSTGTWAAAVYEAGTTVGGTATIMTREKGDNRYTLAASAMRYKEDVQYRHTVLDFDSIQPATFTWGGELPADDPRRGRQGAGFIAEDLHDLHPLLTMPDPDTGLTETIDVLALVAALHNFYQNKFDLARDEIISLRQRVKALEDA